MRRKLIFPFLILLAVIYAGCQKETLESSNNSTEINVNETANYQAVEFQVDVEMFKTNYDDNEARLAKLSTQSKRDCMQTVWVPDDFLSIQEAVDAVCEGGNVFVNSGIYDEVVFITRPGIFLKAVGDVTVNGNIQALYTADNVRIHNFIINASVSSAVAFAFVEGGEAKHNTISGSGLIGVLAWGSNGISIKNNHVSGLEWGIMCATGLDDGSTCNNNMILNNTVTGITGLSCIGLQFNSDYNKIIGNTVTNNPITNNAGIMLNSWPEGDNSCDHNIVKNNVANNNGFQGIWVDDGGANNTIGPNNTANSNSETGIKLDMYSSNNHVFNNTALGNTVCDIVDEGGTDNTYKNNTVECTSGI